MTRAPRVLRSNHAAHPDAREAAFLFSPSQSRAGGRERSASKGEN